MLFVGYQAEGTLGRSLLEGAKTVRLFNEEVAVQARIASMPGKSGHADQRELLHWLSEFKEKPRKVFVNHGEDQVATFFAGLIQEKLGTGDSFTFQGETYVISGNEPS